MFKLFIKSTLRNLIKFKGHTIINIVCLGLGLLVFLLAALWIFDELSYDKFHENHDNIYRVIVENKTAEKTETSIFSPGILGQYMQENYAEVENSCRMLDIPVGWLIETEEKKFRNDRILSADPSFFSMFTFPIQNGDDKNPLSDKYSIVISQKMAAKYFGTENPIGKTITIEIFPFTVTGVMQNVPTQSHLQFDCIIPYEFWYDFYRIDLARWDMNFAYTYVELNPKTNAQEFFAGISDIINENYSEKDQTIISQPLADVHLKSNYDNDLSFGLGDIKTVRIFAIAALLVLIIAIINYVNLSTSHSLQKAKEIGVKKIIGATRKNIAWQVLFESLIFTFLAFAAAITAMELLLPVFKGFVEKSLSFSNFLTAKTIFFTILIVITTAVAGGLYPAFIISRIKSLNIIKNISDKGRNKQVTQKFLVVLQYSISLIAILAAVIISQQMNFINKKDLGFQQESVLYFIMRGDFQTNFESAKQELLSYPAIESVSLSRLPNENSMPETEVDWPGKTGNPAFLGSTIGIDHFKTFGMKMKTGRTFTSNPADSSGFIINETAAKLIGSDQIIGTPFSFRGNDGEIIGVVQDYHHDSLHKPILPKVHYLGENIWICVRINSKNEKAALDAIRTIWDRSAEGYPFEYSFLQDDMNHYYGSEIKLEKAVTAISILTILISSLGLFGLVAHSINRRQKEIGIRKVLGASVSSILLHLVSDFTRWILLANLIAWPLAWYFISKWLQDFSYHIELDIWIFILSGMIALFIAVATISFRTIKAALSNPVDALKYE